MQDKNAIDNFFEKKFLDGLYNANNTENCAIKNIPLTQNNKKIDLGNDNIENIINQNQYAYLNELKKKTNLNDSVNNNDLSNNINNNFSLNNNPSLNNNLISSDILNLLKKNETNLIEKSSTIQDYLPSLKNILKNNSLSNRNNIININSINNINTINKINDLNQNLSQNCNFINDNVLPLKDNMNTTKNFPIPIFPTLFNLLNPNNNNKIDITGNINSNSSNNNSVLNNINLNNENALDYLLFNNELSNINKSGIDTNSIHRNNNENNILLGLKRSYNDI